MPLGTGLSSRNTKVALKKVVEWLEKGVAVLNDNGSVTMLWCAMKDA
jgi:hypothetical protein